MKLHPPRMRPHWRRKLLLGSFTIAALIALVALVAPPWPPTPKDTPPAPGPGLGTTRPWSGSTCDWSSTCLPQELADRVALPAALNNCTPPPLNRDGIPMQHRHPETGEPVGSSLPGIYHGVWPPPDN